LKGRDMNGFKISATIGAAVACFALNAMGQGMTTSDPKKTPQAEETKDQAKAPPPKTTGPKKAVPNKTPAKAPPKKVDAKATRTPQGGTVQKYEAGKAPDLKDSKGNIIQTSPDAYDVSSATNPPAKKK
jgi:hypothetical protein